MSGIEARTRRNSGISALGLFSRRLFPDRVHSMEGGEDATLGGAGLQATFDSAWRRRALAGRPRAVQALADAALLPLVRYCFHRVGGNRYPCEEVVQETLLRALRDLEDDDPSRCGNNIFPAADPPGPH